MNEIAEKEISEKIKGMTQEEQIVVAECLPDSILWVEIQSRYARAKSRLGIIESTVNA